MELIIAGDYCPRARVSKLLDDGDYYPVLGQIKSIIDASDYSIVNFECSVVKGAEEKIEKCGENLSCTVNAVEALKWSGFKCLTLANNHFRDFGDEGVFATQETCTVYELDNVGGGLNLKLASKTLVRQIKDRSIAIINCCEHEFSIATQQHGGCNPLNPISQYYAIKEAKETCDYVIVIVHGGNEYYAFPSPRMQETYRFFVDSGADVVVNHHQHCYSGYEEYHNGLIFYGLGNFCFDEPEFPDLSWNEGFFLKLDFNTSNIDFELVPYIQCREKPEIRLMSPQENTIFFNRIKEINAIIEDDEKLALEYNQFLNQSNYNMEMLLGSPFYNRWVLKIKKLGLIPTIMSRKRKLILQAYMQCESHYPKIMNYLSKR